MEAKERRRDDLLFRERKMQPTVHAFYSPLERQQDKSAVVTFGECHEALHLARAVRLGSLANAYDATPEDFVKEVALQLEHFVLSGGTKCSPDTFDYGAIHNLVQTITLFLKTVSDEVVIDAAADACTKTMEYIGKEDRARKEEVSGYPAFYLEQPFMMVFLRTEVIDAISSLCERIIQRADAPVVDSADGKPKPPKRKREEYEGDFGAGQLQSAAPAL